MTFFSVPHGTTVFGIPLGMNIGRGRSPLVVRVNSPFVDGEEEQSINSEMCTYHNLVSPSLCSFLKFYECFEHLTVQTFPNQDRDNSQTKKQF